MADASSDPRQQKVKASGKHKNSVDGNATSSAWLHHRTGCTIGLVALSGWLHYRAAGVA